MEIVPFTNNFFRQWDDFVERHPHSTIYHNSSWISLFEEVFGYKQKGFILVDGGDILGGLTLFEVGGLMKKRLVSIPFRDRGGLLVKEGIDPSFFLSEAVELLRREKYSCLVIKGEEPISPALVKRWGLKESRLWVTTQVDLTFGRDKLWKGLENNAQGPVKQAEKYGVEVYFGNSLQDMGIFYNIFLRTRKTLGIPSFPHSFFDTIWNRLCLAKKAKLLLAKKDRLPIAGMLLLLHKDMVIDGYSAYLPQFKSLRANDLLVWRSLEWAAGNGYRLFDFGADSSDQEGLLSFKRKWCGVHKTMYHYFLLDRNVRIDNMDSSQKKYRLIRKGISVLPLPVFSWISGKIVSNFG